MILYGHIIRVGDDLTTDAIIAPQERASGDPAELAAHCLAGVDASIADRVRDGDVLLAGERFGAGDGQEDAVFALQAAGFAAVLCTSADPEFVRIAHTLGLPVLFLKGPADVPEGALVRIDLASGRVAERAGGAILQADPAPPDVVAAVRRSQLLGRMRRVVEEEGFDG